MTEHVLLIFIDGLGLGQHDPTINPFANQPITLGSGCPLVYTLAAKSTDFKPGKLNYGHLSNEYASVIPTDACLGVSGLPQSATGQTALLSGVNAPQSLGYHKSAYPNEALAEILKEHSIFIQCKRLGLQATFANGFRQEYWEMIKKNKRKHSATTLSMLSAENKLRDEEDYDNGEAIYHDITGHFLRALGRSIPYLSPHEAGKRLANITMQNHFTLFEYFMTDFLGHRKQMQPILKIIDDLERFIKSTLSHLDLNKTAVMVTSDHGNVEDLSTSGHTLNPVPTILFGPRAKTLASKINDLTDIVPSILSLLTRK